MRGIGSGGKVGTYWLFQLLVRLCVQCTGRVIHPVSGTVVTLATHLVTGVDMEV